MPPVSLFHEAPIEVLRRHPRTILDVLRLGRHAIRTHDPESLSVQVIDSELTEPQPQVRRADLVLLVKDIGGQPVHTVVLEVQSQRDNSKPDAWFQYVARLATLHQTPVALVVLTFDAGVARWARKPTSFGPNVRFTPIVVGPKDFPEIASVEQAIRDRDLAVLTALVRLAARSPKEVAAHDDEVLRIFEATMRGRTDDVQNVYLSLLHGTMRKEVRAKLRTLVEAHDMGALEIIFEDGKAEGRAEGMAEGMAKGEARALLAILRKRGFLVSKPVEQRIVQTTETSDLERWIDRALEATTIDDVFAD